MTEWQYIDDFPNYLVNESGQILNEWTNHIMTPRTNHQGFLMINLVQDKIQYTRSVALIVANAFLEMPRNRYYNSVIHLNGDRSDCHAENLMWRPRWFAMKYHKMFDLPELHVGVYITDTDESFPRLREACTKYGLIEKDAFIDMQNQEPVFHYGWILRRLLE